MNDEILEAKDAIGQLHGCCCWGRWSDMASECERCQISIWCKPVTERRKSGREPLPPTDQKTKQAEPMPKVSPMEYLKKTLSGKYTCKIQHNGCIVKYTYADGEKMVIVIMVNGDAVQFYTSKFPKGTGVDKLESIEQVEGILRVVL